MSGIELATSDFAKPDFQLHPPWFLLPDAQQIDVKELFWNLEKKVEQNPDKWWPENKTCSKCPEPAVFYQRSVVTGVRIIAEAHWTACK